MSARGWLAILFLLGIACAVPGCDWWNGASETDLAELEDIPTADSESEISPVAGQEGQLQQTPQSNLRVGDRFPLLKTVSQTLTQHSPTGDVSSKSWLEMHLSVTVAELPDSTERKGQKLMMVKYHQVQYSQDLGGKHIEYRSQSQNIPIPVEAQAYHGLVDNGFFFWLGPDNQVADLVDFEAFVERCLKHVAPQRQPQVRAALQASSGAEGIANFVDDSIGLLPPRAVNIGDNWEVERVVTRPLAMNVRTKYALQEINANSADISIAGIISPVTTQAASEHPRRDIRVTIRGGKSYGNCSLDRRTGLPINSRVEQLLEMKVRLSNNVEFEQRKLTETTVKSYSGQGAGEVSADASFATPPTQASRTETGAAQAVLIRDPNSTNPSDTASRGVSGSGLR